MVEKIDLDVLRISGVKYSGPYVHKCRSYKRENNFIL